MTLKIEGVEYPRKEKKRSDYAAALKKIAEYDDICVSEVGFSSMVEIAKSALNPPTE